MNENEIDLILENIGQPYVASNAKPIDQVIFDTGTSFHVAAMRCADPVETAPGKISTPTSPMICCFAFAVELYLKALLQIRNVRDHQLDRLFSKLSPDDRTGIADQYSTLTGRTLAQLEIDIAGMAGAFIMWRYIYEQELAKISVQRLAMIALATFEHCRIARAAWVVDEHSVTTIRKPLVQEVASTIYLGGGITIRARPI